MLGILYEVRTVSRGTSMIFSALWSETIRNSAVSEPRSETALISPWHLSAKIIMSSGENSHSAEHVLSPFKCLIMQQRLPVISSVTFTKIYLYFSKDCSVLLNRALYFHTKTSSQLSGISWQKKELQKKKYLQTKLSNQTLTSVPFTALYNVFISNQVQHRSFCPNPINKKEGYCPMIAVSDIKM